MTRVWEDPWLIDVPGIDEFLMNMEKEAICKAIMSPPNRDDRWVSTRGKKSFYSVKEGYRIARANILLNGGETPEVSHSNSKRLWKQVWSLKIPQKIKFFLWRVLTKANPTMENLFKKQCCVTKLCLICKNAVENENHLFLQSDWVKRAWFGCPLAFILSDSKAADLNSWLEFIFLNAGLSLWQKSFVAVTFWFIWKGRCAFPFENTPLDAVYVFQQAKKWLQEFWEGNGWRNLADEEI